MKVHPHYGVSYDTVRQPTPPSPPSPPPRADTEVVPAQQEMALVPQGGPPSPTARPSLFSYFVEASAGLPWHLLPFPQVAAGQTPATAVRRVVRHVLPSVAVAATIVATLGALAVLGPIGAGVAFAATAGLGGLAAYKVVIAPLREEQRQSTGVGQRGE